jgi:hypothetical protein
MVWPVLISNLEACPGMLVSSESHCAYPFVFKFLDVFPYNTPGFTYRLSDLFLSSFETPGAAVCFQAKIGE